MSSVTVMSITVAVSAMAKLLLIFMLGFLAARYPGPKGMLPQEFTSQCSVLLFNMLGPFLLLSNLAKNISYDRISELWPILVWAFFHIFVGYLVGKLVVAIFRPREEYRSAIVCVLAYTNSVSLPLIMVESVVRSDFFSGYEHALERAIGFFFIYSLAWNVAFYCFGYTYLAGTSIDTNAIEGGNVDEESDHRSPSIRQRIAFTWKMMYTNPNMIALCLAIVIGLIPPLQDQLYTDGTILRPLMQAIQLIGTGNIPLGSLVMAANVALSIKRNFSQEGQEAAPDKGLVVQWSDPLLETEAYMVSLPKLYPSPTELITKAQHPVCAQQVLPTDMPEYTPNMQNRSVTTTTRIPGHDDENNQNNQNNKHNSSNTHYPSGMSLNVVAGAPYNGDNYDAYSTTSSVDDVAALHSVHEDTPSQRPNRYTFATSTSNNQHQVLAGNTSKINQNQTYSLRTNAKRKDNNNQTYYALDNTFSDEVASPTMDDIDEHDEHLYANNNELDIAGRVRTTNGNGNNQKYTFKSAFGASEQPNSIAPQLNSSISGDNSNSKNQRYTFVNRDGQHQNQQKQGNLHDIELQDYRHNSDYSHRDPYAYPGNLSLQRENSSSSIGSTNSVASINASVIVPASVARDPTLFRVFSDSLELRPEDRARGLKMSRTGKFYYKNVEIFPPQLRSDIQDDEEDIDDQNNNQNNEGIDIDEENNGDSENNSTTSQYTTPNIHRNNDTLTELELEQKRNRLRPRLVEVDLPSPLFSIPLSVAIVFSKLVLLPTLCYLTFLLVDYLGIKALIPDDKLFRISLLMLFLTPSAESILVILSKQKLVRQAMAISLIYVYQYFVALVSIAIGITMAFLIVFG